MTGAMKVRLMILSAMDGVDMNERKRMYILSRHVTSWIKSRFPVREVSASSLLERIKHF